jgi:hypothetical protein
MHKEAEEAARSLRARMAAEAEILRKLESEFDHPYLKKRARRARSDAKEADIMFLRPLAKETGRTVQQELAAIGYAETFFQMAVTARKELEDAMATHGNTVVVVP